MAIKNKDIIILSEIIRSNISEINKICNSSNAEDTLIGFLGRKYIDNIEQINIKKERGIKNES
jgi:hypothetical protein